MWITQNRPPERLVLCLFLAPRSLPADRQGKKISELEKEYESKNYSVFKNDLAEIIIEGLSPIQKKYKELSANPDYIKKVLRDGAEKAKAIASQTMAEVRSKIGFLEI